MINIEFIYTHYDTHIVANIGNVHIAMKLLK